MEKINFSIPLIFDNDYIKNIEKINNEATKSKVTSIYNCFPNNFQLRCGFEQMRSTKIEGINNERDFFYYVKKVQDLGLEFIYLLNSPEGRSPIDFYKTTLNVDFFVELLLKNNIKIVRASNTQLISYLSKHYPEIEIRVSTSQEYININQYKNLFETFPNIAEIVPSSNLNKNFEFLKSFNNMFGNKKIELMINEGCLSECPFRVNHQSTELTPENEINKNIQIPRRFYSVYIDVCSSVYCKNFWQSFVLSNIIYPWNIENYTKKYGVTKFKIVGRNINVKTIKNGKIFFPYEIYMRGLEDYNEIKDLPFKSLTHPTSLTGTKLPEKIENITIGQIKNYLPSIEYFEVNGHKCRNICGVECKYCYNLEEKLNKNFPFK